MLDFDFDFDCFTLNSRCLSFLVLTNKQFAFDASEEEILGLSYCLEAGIVHWSGTPNSQSSPIYLRENRVLGPSDRDQLASWEPMNATKMGLIALKLGVVGDERTTPEGPSEPFLSAVTISPQGILLQGTGNTISVSDVRTLAASQDPFNESTLGYGYTLNTTSGEVRPNFQHPQTVEIDSGVLPVIEEPRYFEVDSLAQWGENAITLLAESGNDPEGEFSAESVGFIQRYFGVDVSLLDWEAANMARLVNAGYSSPTKAAAVPFNPHKALRALRVAIDTNANKNQATNPASPAAGQTYRKSDFHKGPHGGPSH